MSSKVKSEILMTSDSCGQMANVSVFDSENGSLLTNFKGFTSGFGSLCVMANTFLLSANPSKPLLNVWPVWRGEQRPVKQTLPGVATALAVSNDAQGAIIAVAVNEVIYIWMTASGSLVNVINSGGHYQRVSGLSFTPDASSSHLVSVGDDGNIFVWSTATLVGSPNPRPLHSWSSHSLEITGHQIGASGTRVYTCSLDQTAKIHELTSGNLLLNVTFAIPLTAIAVDTLEATVVVGAKSGNIHKFSLSSPPRDLSLTLTPDKANTFKGHNKAVRCLALSVSGQVMASGSDDFDVRVWDVKSGLSLRTLTHKGPLTNVRFQQVIPGLLGDPMSGTSFKPNASLMPFSKMQGSDDSTEIELIVRDPGVPSAFEENFYECQDQKKLVYLNGDMSERSNGADQEETLDNPEVSKLKEINLQLYQQALKSILSTSKPLD